MSVISEWMLVDPSIIKRVDEYRETCELDTLSQAIETLLKNQKTNLLGQPVVRKHLNRTMIKFMSALTDFQKTHVGAMITYEEMKDMATYVNWSPDTMRRALNNLVKDEYLIKEPRRKGPYTVMKAIKPSVLLKYGDA